MSIDDRILDLLQRWEDLRDKGQPITPEQLCHEFPELLEEIKRRIQDLERLPSMISTVDENEAGVSGELPADQRSTLIQHDSPTIPGTPSGMTMRYGQEVFHKKGGLGEVYKAQDIELGRQVALKRMKAHLVRHADSRLRFLREAEITGRLEHPGVVPVYGLVHDQEGHPCYAMRFIEGESLKDAIKKFHEADKIKRDPGERILSLRQLLGQFIAVCKTLAYAHSRGIIHRDIKPDNIMLGKYGETLVVDWGLAKFLEKPEEQKDQDDPSLKPKLGSGGESTQEGMVVGTPAYMSPEQAVGEWETVGPQSDIYSLGATLYSILTGRAPFPPGDPRDKVKRGEFPTPRSVNKTVPRALEAICLKAMSLWPQDRYSTCLKLAEDVEHWLADEPVECFHEPLAVRLARWLRRQRTVAATIGTLSLAGIAFLVFYAVYARLSESRISHEKDIADEQRQKAEALASLTRDSLNQFSSDVIEVLLAKKKQLDPGDRKFLEDAIKLNEKLVASTGDSEASQSNAANTYWRIGQIQRVLGIYDRSVDAYGRGLEAYQQLAANYPDKVEYQAGAAECIAELGVVQEKLRRMEEAENDYRQALEMREKLTNEHPGITQYQEDLALTYSNLGNLLSDTKRPDKAEEAYRQAIDIRTKLVNRAPAEPEPRRSLAFTYNNLGILLSVSNRKESEFAYQKALELRKKLAEEFPGKPDYRNELAFSFNNLGTFLLENDQTHEAKKQFQEAANLWNALANQFPSVAEYRAELALCYNNLGTVLLDTDGLTEAEKVHRMGITLAERLANDFPKVLDYRNTLGQLHNQLALDFIKVGRNEDAEKEFRNSAAIFKKLAEDAPTVVEHRALLGTSYLNQGGVLVLLNRLPESESAYKKSLDIRRGLVKDLPQNMDYQNDIADTLDNLANVLLRRKEPNDALKLLEEAIPYHQSAIKSNPQNPSYKEGVKNNEAWHGDAFAQLGRYLEAAAAAEKLTQLAMKPDQDFKDAASIFARSAVLAQQDSKLPQAKREELARSYSSRAVDAIQRAIKAGFKDVKQLNQDPDFEGLRGREDFKKLTSGS